MEVDAKHLDDLIGFVKTATAERFYGWQWNNNTRCKYIDIRIDMRDGSFIIKDRRGERITFKILQGQEK